MNRDRQPKIEGLALAQTMRERLYGQGAYKELHEKRMWLNWRLERINGEWKKVPYNPRNGYRASTTAPETWGYLPQALKRLELGNMSGIGLAVGPDDPYVIVDVDERQDRDQHAITGILGQRVFSLLHTTTEFSPNFGLHFLGKLTRPLPEAVKDEVEIYFEGRYMTVTADLVPGSPLVIATCQEAIEQLFEESKGYSFDQALSTPSRTKKVTRGRRVGGDGMGVDTEDWRTMPENHFDDDEREPARPTEKVLHMMLTAPNREHILELWENRWQGNPRYQDHAGNPDDSRADMALVKFLLYWTGGHKAQTNKLFEQSGLMRSKWRDRVNSGGSGHSYGEVTIVNCVNWLQGQAERRENPPARR